MDSAPFFAEVADAPGDGRAWWVRAGDGVRLRVGAFNTGGETGSGAEAGTVLLFPGRTEYIEKYGRAARDLARHGFATLTVDWRGQGLADRLTDDPMSGHVLHFADYQKDVAATVAAARALGLPRPWYLLAHSMGGCIGLRAVLDGLDVQACAFSGPMWGVQMADIMRLVAWSVSWSGRQLGMGHVYAPGTDDGNYVLDEPFETNKLTNDRDMYQYMIDQSRAHPELGLGGPSLRWLHEALRETRNLARLPSPDLPCLTVAGTDEEIVDTARIRERMERWPGGRLDWIEGGRHEVLMETPEIRTAIFDDICRLFAAAGAAPSGGGLSPAARAASGARAP